MKNTYGSCVITPNDIVKVYDGDTITVNIRTLPDIVGHEIGIRIIGIDTPEIRGSSPKEKALAYEARDYLKKLLCGNDSANILLSNLQRDKYFRLLADVSILVPGQFPKHVSSLMREQGYAVLYNGGTKPDWDKIIFDREQKNLNL